MKPRPEMMPVKMSIALQRIFAYVDAFREYERRTKEQQESYERMMATQKQLTDYDKKVFDRLIEQKFGKEAMSRVASEHRP